MVPLLRSKFEQVDLCERRISKQKGKAFHSGGIFDSEGILSLISGHEKGNTCRETLIIGNVVGVV